VVTGGGGGLGRAIGAALAGLGLRVWLADLDEVAAQRAADAVGSGVSGCALDVTDAEACRALAAQVQQDGGLAVWVNNAGVLFTRSSWEHPEREVRTMFDVNVHGTMNGTFAALEVMRPAGVGHVVNVVSLAGLAAPPGEAVYAATKHAALAFTTGTQQDLRADGVRGIHLSAVCPDGIWTPMLYDKVDDPHAAASWSGVLLSPERVAAQVARVVQRPRPITSVPGWRGGMCRVYSATPRVALATRPLLLAVARRNQKAFAKSHPRPAG
jgi:NAD(P)-dependent dehydrogenase (short-subunit alcohol dehydrogenase family)